MSEFSIYPNFYLINKFDYYISRYRKFHLYGEGVQTTEKPDLTTFRTDFNVTFGMCICFDLIFDYPQNGLVERGVRNFVYPTMWFSEIPYLSGKNQGNHFHQKK